MTIVISLILFLLIAILCFTLPGTLLLQKSKTIFVIPEKIVLGTIIGFVMFTLTTYILLTLNASFLLLPIIGFLDILSMRYLISTSNSFRWLPKKQLLILLIVFVIGIVGQMAIVAPSGTYKGKDLVFWSSNGHDGPWHIALIEAIKKGYPLQNPVLAGEKLVNYHFFSDIAPAQFSKYFHFSNLDLYFRFFPLLFSILLGSIAYLFGKKIGESFKTGLWSVFFVYFAGSFGYIVTWMQSRTIGGESIFWATQIQSSIGNPPQIISNFLILAFLYLLIIYLSKKDWYIFGLCVLILGTLAEFKIYAAIVMLISLGIVGLIQFIKTRKVHLLSLSILSGILSAVLYLPNASKSSSFLIFEPWWFIRTMIVAQQRLNWLDLELRRQTYLAEGNWKRVIQLELTGFLIFFFGNLGTRFLGLISSIELLRKAFNSYLNQLLLLIILVSLILPLLFLQKGVAGNTEQFLQYFLLIFGILSALTISRIQNSIKSRTIKVFFIFLIIISSIPTQLGLLYDFYHKPPLAKITSKEIEALDFLKGHTATNSVILTPPFDKNLNLKTATPDIWAWFDTAYISAFSSRRTYLSDTEQTDIMGYDINERLKQERNIFLDINDPTNFNDTIKQINVNYLYFPKILKPKLDLNKSDLKKVFDNDYIEIWKTN